MRNLPICLLLVVSFLGVAKPSHAELMHVLGGSGSFEGTRYDELYSFNIKIGDLSPYSLGGVLSKDFGKTVSMDHLIDSALTKMLTRTFPIPEDPDLSFLSDVEYMVLTNEFITWAEVWPKDPYVSFYTEVSHEPIPDFSGHNISAYYLTQSWFDDGFSVTYDFELLADATPVAAPVPEPSTLLTLLAGATGLGYLRWRKPKPTA